MNSHRSITFERIPGLINWTKWLYLFSIGIYIILAIEAVSRGYIGWDEEGDYRGLRAQINHAILFLQGKSPDYKEMFSNNEFYGVIGLLPAWIIWAGVQFAKQGSFRINELLEGTRFEHLTSDFYTYSHLTLALEFILLTYIVTLISKKLSLKFYWLSGVFCLIMPSLLGHSFNNNKDIPFALFYTIYSLCLIYRFNNNSLMISSISAIFAGFLINLKAVTFIPVFISEFIFSIIKNPKKSLKKINKYEVLKIPLVALFLSLIIQPAAWGLRAWDYFPRAIVTFAVHSWPGCMWFNDNCIGINQTGWNTFFYTFKWLSVKIPLFFILLILISIVNGLKNYKKVNKLFFSPWLFIVLQVILVPSLAILRNSNLYDQDRHLLFIYPGLCIIASLGLEKLISFRGYKKFIYSGVTLLFLFFLLIDLFNLQPYQSSYINELSRRKINHKNTAIEYWGLSAKELLNNSQLRKDFPKEMSFTPNYTWPPSFYHAYLNLDGKIKKDGKNQLVFQFRNPVAFKDRQGCKKVGEVSRKILFADNLVMSGLLICETNDGKLYEWN